VRGRVGRLIQQRLVTDQLVGVEEVEEAEVDHAVLAVAWAVVVEDLPNFGVVREAEAEAEAEEGGEEGEVEDFDVAQVVEAVEGEGEEDVGSAVAVPGFVLAEQHVVDVGFAVAVPGFVLAEQHVMGLVEPRVEDHCDRGEAPG
jgi:hypothetical protein